MNNLVFVLFGLLFSTLADAQKLVKLTIVIDDMGNNINDFQALDLPKEIAFSILPFTPRGKQLAKKAQLQDRDFLVHIPMQAVANNQKLGKGALMLDMQEQQFKAELQRSLDHLPNALGINNHMGSLLTTQQLHMNWTMQVLKKQRLLFLDSRTTANTIAAITAQRFAIPSISRNVFLDNIKTSEAMEIQFQRAIRLSHNKASTIIIAHPYPETITFLQQKFKIPIDGVQLISLDQLIPNNQTTVIEADKVQQANNYSTNIESLTQAQ
ncbi:MAG: divergent polysaccharide deacetylase family protein [Psychromonas sp.]